MRRLLRWSRKWWPGFIPLAILWVVAAWTGMSPIESDLASHVRTTLKDTVLDKLRVVVSGRDVRFGAEAFSEEGRRSAVSSVEAVPGVRLVIDQTQLVPVAKPYIFTAERDVVRVTLSGNAPLPAVKARLLDSAHAALGNVEVVDRIALARGAPARFDAATLILIDQISKLKEGKITLTDTVINLSGQARDVGGREAIVAALRNLPEGYTVAENSVMAPPYIFQANKDPVSGTLTLTGYVPDPTVHAALVAAAERKFFSERVVDNLKVSNGAPTGFMQGVIAAMEALSRVSTGTLAVTDREIRVSGDALYETAIDQIKAGLGSGVPQGWRVRTEMSVKPPASPVDATVCQQLLSDLLKKGKIQFRSGSAAIDPDSAGLLDRLIETALRCPNAMIEIAGHTDTDGDGDANQKLSEERAQAVEDYLVRGGLAPTRFAAVGYGSTRPVASNDTPEGKAENRRIEFLVR